MTRYSLGLTLALTLALAACGPGEDHPAPPAESAAAAPAAAPPAPPAADDTAGTEEPDLAEVVATVNGEPITRRLLAGQVALAAADRPPADEADQAADHRDLQAEQLRNLISLELACQEALRLGYAPAEDELTRALELFKSDFEAPDQLYKVLDQYGSTEDDLKRQLIRNMALKKWQANEFLAEITVSDDEAREFYQRNSDLLRHDEMVRLSQILVGVSLLAPPAVKNQARAKAEAALKRLEAGEDFGAVAAQVNSEPEAAENRGDQGWFVRGQSLPAIEAAVWGLPVGGRTGLLESILGFHLIEVTDRRPAGLDSFENLRLDIVEFLAGRKLDEALARKMAALTRAADIEILDAELKGALPAAVPADEAK